MIGNTQFSLRDFFFIVFYKKNITIGIPFIVILVTTIYSLSVKPLYYVSASILVKPFFDSRRSLSSNYLNVLPVTQLDINTEREILLSRELALDVIKKLKMKMHAQEDSLKIRLGISSKATPEDNTVDYIVKGLDISSVTTSSVILVEKVGGDPEEITDIVNAYVDCYIDRHIDIHRSKSEISFYEDGLKDKKEELDGLEKKLSELIKNYNIVNVENQKNYNISMLKTLRESLNEIDGDIAEKSRTINYITNNKFNATTKEFREDQVIATIASNYISLLPEKDKIASLYNKGSVEYKTNKKLMDSMEDELHKEKERILNGLSVELDSLREKKKTTEDNIEKIKNESLSLSLIAVKYDDVNRSIEQTQRIYNLYSDKLEEENIQIQRDRSGVSNVSVISRAHVPSIPVFPKKFFMLTIAIVAGTAAGIGAAFTIYYMDRTVKEPNDILRTTEISLVFSLEDIKK